eukprot:scaffold24067_cov29-Phaeocystis_antarctica.AAC.1
MERRGGRDSGKSVNGAMFGVVAREHEQFGPNRAGHPNRAGLLRLRRCLNRRRPSEILGEFLGVNVPFPAREWMPTSGHSV